MWVTYWKRHTKWQAKIHQNIEVYNNIYTNSSISNS